MRWPINLSHSSKQIFFDTGICLFLVFIGCLIYRSAFSVPFVFDDVLNIVENPVIRSISNLQSLWHYDPSRFLTHYTFALNFHFGGLEVYGYHLVNLIIHLLVGIAGYLFFTLLLDDSANSSPALFPRRRWIMAFAALLFVCHPIQTQAVTYVSQRSTPLAALSYLTTLIFYIRFRTKCGWKNYMFALIFAFWGLFTKPIIITLPLAIFLYEVMFLSRGVPRQKRIYVGLAPFIFLSLVVPVLLILWRDKAFDPEQILSITRESDKYTRVEYFLTQVNVIMMYLRLLFFPVNLKLDYDFPIAKNFFSFPTWLSFLAIAAILYTAVKLYRKHKILSFGLFWIFVTLSLESSIFPIADVIFEHRLYLPMAGFAIGIAYALGLATVKKPKVFVIISCLIVVVCSVLTYRRNVQWQDVLTFYKDMAEHFPNKARIHNNLGNYYVEKKDWDMALKQYKQALEFDPDNQGTYNNIANVYSEQGRYTEAIEELESILKRDQQVPAAYYNLGIVYLTSSYKDYSKAMYYFSKTLELNPMFAPAMVGIARVYSLQAQPDKARFYLEQAKAVNPSYAPIFEDLGHLYLAQKQYDLAFKYYLEALSREPDLALVHNNLGNLYAMRGKNDLAKAEYQKAISCAKDFAGPYKNMGDLLKEEGRFSEARLYYKKALELFREKNEGMMMEKIQNELKNMP